MTTAAEIVVGALRAIAVIDVGEAASAEDMADGLTALNDMIASWAMKGIHTGAPILAVNDPFPFEDGHVAGVKAMLAEYIADDYGKALPPNVAKRAIRGWQAIYADYTAIEPLRIDCGLTVLPSQRRWFD